MKLKEDDEVDIDAIMNEIMDDMPTEGYQPEEDMVVEYEAPEGESGEVVVPASKDIAIDLEEKNALANAIVKNSLDIVGNAKKVFDNFSDDVFHGKDRSTSSKEAMLKALDVQNNANKNMIDLAKVLSGKGEGGGTNILVQAVSEKQAGISINNMREHV